MNRARRRGATSATRLEPLSAAVLEHHQAGRLPEAEVLYRQVLAATPRHPDALHFLGVVAYQTGRHALAAHLIGLAITENPNAAMFHSNLGNTLKELGRPGQAIAALQRAAALEPTSADYLYNLALALHAADNVGEAEARYRAAIRFRPSFAEAYDSLALPGHFQVKPALTTFRLLGVRWLWWAWLEMRADWMGGLRRSWP